VRVQAVTVRDVGGATIRAEGKNKCQETKLHSMSKLRERIGTGGAREPANNGSFIPRSFMAARKSLFASTVRLPEGHLKAIRNRTLPVFNATLVQKAKKQNS